MRVGERGVTRTPQHRRKTTLSSLHHPIRMTCLVHGVKHATIHVIYIDSTRSYLFLLPSSCLSNASV